AVAVEDGGERGALADEDRGGRRRQRKPGAGIADQDERERRGAGVRRRGCGDRDWDAGCGLRARRAQHQLAGRLRRGDDERIRADTRGQRCGYLDGICKPVEASDGDGHSRRTARLERQLSRHYRNRKRAFLRKPIAASRRARTERHGGDEAAKNRSLQVTLPGQSSPASAGAYSKDAMSPLNDSRWLSTHPQQAMVRAMKPYVI